MARLDLSLTPKELTAYLEAQRTIRLATVSPAGTPHVVPLWFVWIDGTAFMNTTLGNVTVANLEAKPGVSGLVDDGDRYEELRGVLLHGRIERAEGDPRLDRVRATWSVKYMGGNPLPYDRWRDRIWLRLTPDRMTSWDFRKIPEAKARARGGQ